MLRCAGCASKSGPPSGAASSRDKVPTANFFQARGYRDNPVAQRNNVVSKLLAATDAAMDNEVKKPGAQELAADFP